MATTPTTTRTRVPASERRDALIDAAVHEFARRGLYGTPVDGIARRVGVAQPYVFSLFGSKKELFLAAVERGFQLTADTFTKTAAAYDPAIALPDTDVLKALGHSYVELLESEEHRDYLMLQHHAYAACDDPEIRARVRALYARLVAHVERLADEAAARSGTPPPEPEEVDEFFRYGMWLNVAAAMGVEDLSAGCDWMRDQVDADRA
jgi:AcrR family transcriptional regulator